MIELLLQTKTWLLYICSHLVNVKEIMQAFDLSTWSTYLNCMSNIVITFTFLHDITFLALEFVNFEINLYIFFQQEKYMWDLPIQWHWLFISISIIRKIMTLFCQVWIFLAPRSQVLLKIISITLLEQVGSMTTPQICPTMTTRQNSLTDLVRNHHKSLQSSSLSF